MIWKYHTHTQNIWSYPCSTPSFQLSPSLPTTHLPPSSIFFFSYFFLPCADGYWEYLLGNGEPTTSTHTTKEKWLSLFSRNQLSKAPQVGIGPLEPLTHLYWNVKLAWPWAGVVSRGQIYTALHSILQLLFFFHLLFCVGWGVVYIDAPNISQLFILRFWTVMNLCFNHYLLQ